MNTNKSPQAPNQSNNQYLSAKSALTKSNHLLYFD